MNKTLSAGLVMMDGDNRILICHPTMKPKGKGFWDIPKGGVEEGEKPLDAAVRELKEETGIVLSSDMLYKLGEDCGVFKYNDYKDLHIFCIRFRDNRNAILLRQGKLKCTSTFEYKGRQVPEMNDYMMTDDLSYLYPKLQPIVKQVVERCMAK